MSTEKLVQQGVEQTGLSKGVLDELLEKFGPIAFRFLLQLLQDFLDRQRVVGETGATIATEHAPCIHRVAELQAKALAESLRLCCCCPDESGAV